MKKIFYILVVFVFTYGLGSCDQDIDFPYQGKPRIQFKHYNVQSNGNRQYIDSVVFSFGMKTVDVKEDTAKVVLEFLGENFYEDKTYYVCIDGDSTTAVAGKHYKEFDKTQVFRGGRQTDTLRILIYRENLSASFSNPVNELLELFLEESDDFDLGLMRGHRLKLLLNNYLSEPAWWEGNFSGGLGYYHPQKWRILMSFHEDFMNEESCPFNINNAGRNYATGLRNYLNDIPTYDEETGQRIFMDYMQDVE